MKRPFEYAELEDGHWRVRFELFDDEDPELSFLGEFTNNFNPPCIDRKEGIFYGHHNVWYFTIPEHLVLDDVDWTFQSARETRLIRARIARQEQGGNTVYIGGDLINGMWHIEVWGQEVLKCDIGTPWERWQMRYYLPVTKPCVHVFQDRQYRCERNEFIRFTLHDWNRLEDYGNGWFYIYLHATLHYKGRELLCEGLGMIESDDRDTLEHEANTMLNMFGDSLDEVSLHPSAKRAGKKRLAEWTFDLHRWGLDWRDAR